MALIIIVGIVFMLMVIRLVMTFYSHIYNRFGVIGILSVCAFLALAWIIPFLIEVKSLLSWVTLLTFILGLIGVGLISLVIYYYKRYRKRKKVVRD